MSRNGSGTYNLPGSDNPVVSNTPISSVSFNNTMNDIASALTQSLSADGQTPVVQNQPMSGFKHQNVADAVLQNEYASFKQVAGNTVTVTAAATTDIGTPASNNITISGDATITAFGLAAEGVIKFVRFSPVFGCTITNSSSIQLPQAVNITARAGDNGIFKSLGGGNWVCLLFQGYGANVQATSMNGGPLAGLKNLLINGDFRLNQRGYASGILPSGTSYAHDRWKLTGGAPYTFNQNVDDAIIFLGVTPATSIISQVVEDLNCEFTNYVLSWDGTVEGRINTPSAIGTFGPSPITISGALKGVPVTVQFRTTSGGGNVLQRAQLEGSNSPQYPTPFERRHVGLELLLAQRYAWVAYSEDFLAGMSASSTVAYAHIKTPVTMRSLPTLSLIGSGGIVFSDDVNTDYTNASPTLVTSGIGVSGGRIQISNMTGLVASRPIFGYSNPTYRTGILFSAEL